MKIFSRIAYYWAEIDKNLDFLGHIIIYVIKLPQNFGSCWKMSPGDAIGNKVENKHKNENISTGKLLLVMSGVSRNQKLSTKYDFYGFEVSLEVLTDQT